jgi:hypothetical protein
MLTALVLAVFACLFSEACKLLICETFGVKLETTDNITVVSGLLLLPTGACLVTWPISHKCFYQINAFHIWPIMGPLLGIWGPTLIGFVMAIVFSTYVRGTNVRVLCTIVSLTAVFLVGGHIARIESN